LTEESPKPMQTKYLIHSLLGGHKKKKSNITEATPQKFKFYTKTAAFVRHPHPARPGPPLAKNSGNKSENPFEFKTCLSRISTVTSFLMFRSMHTIQRYRLVFLPALREGGFGMGGKECKQRNKKTLENSIFNTSLSYYN
jgi:hypothetical protein